MWQIRCIIVTSPFRHKSPERIRFTRLRRWPYGHLSILQCTKRRKSEGNKQEGATPTSPKAKHRGFPNVVPFQVQIVPLPRDLTYRPGGHGRTCTGSRRRAGGHRSGDRHRYPRHRHDRRRQRCSHHRHRLRRPVPCRPTQPHPGPVPDHPVLQRGIAGWRHRRPDALGPPARPPATCMCWAASIRARRPPTWT
jgi:hypothetical protein